ncbi:zinc finger protein 607-like isoform X2 [Pseudomyrmex gracilis]|uniref:zinc finger protein 607-like isoform X2 n=1 Tax=Pseudomyrmex gracilis TaxID=219809 RepID=UPI000995B52B|nr:zinc finger protein 607-like isoform X2 [Pseudomyrmex gracilis]
MVREDNIRSNGVKSQTLLSHFVLQCFNILLCLCWSSFAKIGQDLRLGALNTPDGGEDVQIVARATHIKLGTRFSEWYGCSDLGLAVRSKVYTRGKFKPDSCRTLTRVDAIFSSSQWKKVQTTDFITIFNFNIIFIILKMALQSATEEAQTLLLEGVEGAPCQFIIQRSDGESLSKGVPLFTLSGELISEGMVVDMINADVSTDYNTSTQYYEADDLLTHGLTEDDRRLAAALVAVQLHQQQKQQQINVQHEDSTLSDVSHLETLAPVNSYTIHTIPEPNSTASIYTQTLQPFTRIPQSLKQEFINVKSEYDIEVSTESSEDATSASGPKRTLPHKKRISRKLKQPQTKKNATRKDNSKSSQENSTEFNNEVQANVFKCQICSSKFSSQLKFFEHLKVHYEPVKQETRIAQATNTNITISVPETVHTLENTVIEEFSEPEDLMEGIRGVVEETGAHIDDDTDSVLPSTNNESTMWAITDVTEQVQQKDQEIRPPSVNDNKSSEEKSKTDIPYTAKKKKSPKARKSSDGLTCLQCNRSFHHKNSLVYHMRSHSGERPHQCDICNKRFFAASALKVHKRLHSGDKPYKCEVCGRHFRQWGDLKYHSTSLHSEHKQYQCEFCAKEFARKYSLIVHRRIHTGEKNYRCEYCSKTFRASSYLQNHRRIHTGEKPHACVVCGKPFRVRSDMKRHMHTHSRTKTNEKQLSSTNKIVAGKHAIDTESIDKKAAHAKTIQDLVRDLKLEVDATGVVEIVAPDDNPETILPHTSGQNLEYTVTSTADTAAADRDPLEAVVRTNDNIQYFFM